MVLKNQPKIFLEPSGSMETENMLENPLISQKTPGGQKNTSSQAAAGPVLLLFSHVSSAQDGFKKSTKNIF